MANIVLIGLLILSTPGELGWELYVTKENTKKLYDALLDAGEEFGIGDFGTFAMASLRLEKGFRGWGAEVMHSSFYFLSYR